MNNQLRKYETIENKELFFWNHFYWEPLQEITHDCGRKLEIFKKYRKLKGKLEEIKQSNKICPNCQADYTRKVNQILKSYEPN